jgi:hypothetical protein
MAASGWRLEAGGAAAARREVLLMTKLAVVTIVTGCPNTSCCGFLRLRLPCFPSPPGERGFQLLEHPGHSLWQRGSAMDRTRLAPPSTLASSGMCTMDSI